MKTDEKNPADLILKLLCAQYVSQGSERSRKHATEILVAVASFLSTTEGYFEATNILQSIADDIMQAGEKRQPNLKRNSIV